MAKKCSRALSLILCAVMLGTSFVSCSEEGARNSDETAAGSTGTESTTTTTATETETEEEKKGPDLPDVNYGGYEFRMLGKGQQQPHWQSKDLTAEEMNGEPINDAVFERNEYLNSTYNIKLAEYQTQKDTLSELKTEVTANTGAFQAAMTHFENGATLSRQGALMDMYSLPYIDVTKPWWDHSGVEALEVMGSLYQATGDITVIDNDATWVLFFNKQMREDLQLDNLYDLVRENKWDFDKFYELLSVAPLDVNADGKMSYKDDRYGMITSDQSGYGLLYASGISLLVPDKDEVFKIDSDFEKLSSVVDAAAKIMADQNMTFITGRESSGSDDVLVAFEEGRGLFFGEVMQCATRMRSSDTDFGLIPWPKYELTQDAAL